MILVEGHTKKVTIGTVNIWIRDSKLPFMHQNPQTEKENRCPIKRSLRGAIIQIFVDTRYLGIAEEIST